MPFSTRLSSLCPINSVVLFIICLWVLVRGRRRGYEIPWYEWNAEPFDSACPLHLLSMSLQFIVRVIFTGVWCQFILSTVHMSMVLAASIQIFMTAHGSVIALVTTWGQPVFNLYTQIQQLLYVVNVSINYSFPPRQHLTDFLSSEPHWRLHIGSNYSLSDYPVICSVQLHDRYGVCSLCMRTTGLLSFFLCHLLWRLQVRMNSWRLSSL